MAAPHGHDYPNLQQIWSEPHPQGLVCCVCSQLIGGQALIRTLRLRNVDESIGGEHRGRTLRFKNSELKLFDRHMTCIQGSQLSYVAISHVWDREISETQDSRKSHAESSVVARVFAAIHGVFRGLADDGHPNSEIWYDYLSVPQWEGEMKHRILRAIPDIFRNASFTLVLMTDVDTAVIHKLRTGHSTKERLEGVTGICNAKWFKRVWTLMEYGQSPKVKVMTKGFQIAEGVRDVFYHEVGLAWSDEVSRHGNAHTVEAIARMGTNIVPWNLGPIWMARADGFMDYGSAFAMLSPRGCQSSNDFLHALLGSVRAELPGAFEHDLQAALRQIAFGCMQQGDYSPLMVTPIFEGDDHRKDAEARFRHGYLDVLTFGFGRREDRQAHTVFHASNTFAAGAAHLNLEKIGMVRSCIRIPASLDKMLPFLRRAQVVLDVNGPDVDEFVKAVGGRMYHQTEQVEKTLADPFSRKVLGRELRTWYDSKERNSRISDSAMSAETVVRTMKLSSPSNDHEGTTLLDFSTARGGSVHMVTRDGVVTIKCSSCHGHFVYRAALFGRPSDMVGAAAYRIPGLKYHHTGEDGAAIILKGGTIVGRMIWASPACPCSQLEEVKIVLNNLPMPNPRDR